MGWNPFKKQMRHADLLIEIDEAQRRQQVYRLAQEAEAWAARLADKTKALREELERGPSTTR